MDKYNWWPQIISSFSAIALVFIGLWAKDLWDRRKKSSFLIEGIVCYPQIIKNKDDNYYFRIVILNNSKYEAKNVTVEVLGLQREDQKVEPYLPAFLNWTHFDKPQRNILSNRKALADLCIFRINSKDDNKLRILSNTEYITDYSALEKGKNKISLEINSDNSAPQMISVQLDWPGGFTKKDIPATKVLENAEEGNT